MKYLLTILFLLGAGFFLGLASLSLSRTGDRPTYTPSYSWGEVDDILLEEQRLQTVRTSTTRFHNVLEAAKHALWHEGVELGTVVDVVQAAAQRDNNTFLKLLSDRFAGVPPREKIALVLIAHLRRDVASRDVPPERGDMVGEMCCEMYAWPGVHPATLAALAAEPAD